VGWNWATRLVEHCDIWVVTRANNRPSIEMQETGRNIHWIYVDAPAWVLRFKRGRLGVWLYYRLWQWLAYRACRGVVAEQSLDLVHHLTFGTYWAPSDMHRLGIPFVVGPVGGGELVPWRCVFSRMSFRGVLYECQRNLAILLRLASPFKRRFIKHITLVVAKNRETKEVLEKTGAHVAGIHTESAIAFDELEQLGNGRDPSRHDEVFRMLCIGELRALKGGHLVIEALGRLKREGSRSFKCTFLGEGAERKRLEKLTKRYGVAGEVRFAGKVPRHEVLEHLGAADVLLHPTLHDSGGWTCLEAMAARVPVISVDIGGPAMQLDGRCGILVEPGSAGRIVEEIRTNLKRLMMEPATVKEMGAAGRKRVGEKYTWDRVVSDFLKYYEMAVR